MGAKDSETPHMESAAKGTSFDEKERPMPPPSAEDILREKSKSKFVRISSVIVYICAVTGNGFLLAVFFLFVWDPQIKASRPSNMAPDYGIFGRLTADHLVADQDQGIMALALKSDHSEHLPAVPHHRIMSDEFTNNYINSFHEKKVPGSGVVGGIGQAEAGVAHGLPSSAHEEYENNASRPEHHATAAAAVATGIQSKAYVSNSGSSEDDSNSSSSFGGSMGKRKKPSEGASSPHQRPQVLQT